jgi:uncharacterized protein (DUF1919 family)
LGRPLDRWLAGREPVTLISEDCWGGEFCCTVGCAYATPLAGAFILSGDYLNFLENFNAPDAFELQPLAGSHSYPVGCTPYATIHFMHAATWAEAAASFTRRVARINRGRLFFKIDFGKSGYTQHDVERWNRLRLRNAVALIPPAPRLGFDFAQVHRGWRMPVWTYDGAAMFHLSRRAFDFHHWIRTGELRGGGWTRVLNWLFWDRLVPAELGRKVRAVLFGPEPVRNVPAAPEPASVGARRIGATALR